MAQKGWREVVPMLIPAVAGLALMAISIFDTRDDAFDSGRAPVFAAGCTFFFAGVAVAASLIPSSRLRHLVQASAGTLLLGGFAFVAIFGALLADDVGPDHVWETRIVGAVAALATVGLTVLGLVGVFRAIRGPKKKPDSPDPQP
jgi:hypothetical protein